MREKKPKILMIDDDEQILFAMKAVFEYQGWESLSAQDVLGGLRLFRSEKPDLKGNALFISSIHQSYFFIT